MRLLELAWSGGARKRERRHFFVQQQHNSFITRVTSLLAISIEFVYTLFFFPLHFVPWCCRYTKPNECGAFHDGIHHQLLQSKPQRCSFFSIFFAAFFHCILIHRARESERVGRWCMSNESPFSKKKKYIKSTHQPHESLPCLSQIYDIARVTNERALSANSK